MSVRWLKNGSFGFACVSAFAVWAKPNVLPKAFGMRLAKIVFEKVRREKNKKSWAGNECRLTRCPFVIFLCLWLLVKMVYFSLVFSRLFDVVGSLRLHLTSDREKTKSYSNPCPKIFRFFNSKRLQLKFTHS